ncbi:MAG: signal recognition particle-docking protein FtsY [Candidatus Nanoarchaeia archaeon]|nr:signal recognition particle-docking protein FtsY [Candidatus Nanoarchaeia archaeon]
MFNFLKDKFKKVVSKFSREVEDEIEEALKPEDIEEKQHGKEKQVKQQEKKSEETKEKPIEKKGEPKKQVEEKLEETKEVEKPEEKKADEEPKKEEEKKGFFKKITDVISKKSLSEKQFDELFFELEIALMENNVAVEVIEKIKQDLKKELVEKQISRKSVKEIIIDTLKKSIEELFDVDKINLFEKINEKKPFVICFVGINGSGKTTTIAKVCRLLQKNNFNCVLAASDTFRAASIEQLQLHADNLKVRLIKHDYGSDPAAVAFDAIKYAESKKQDVVLIDTAGRLHSNSNLMDELKKVVRVAKPDLVIFIGESITGNDCVEQAQKFNDAIGIDGIILTKSDIDEKGGAAVSVSYITKKPILYLGVGQEYDDLKEFEPEIITSNIGL